MKTGLKLLLLPALGLLLASCAAPYNESPTAGGYAYASPYPNDFYTPLYGGVVWDGWGGGWDHHGWAHHGWGHAGWSHRGGMPIGMAGHMHAGRHRA